MKLKKVIYIILLISWMVVIFLFSNQDGTTSQSTSDQVAATIIDTTTKLTKQEMTKEKRNSLIEDTRVLIRKTAHFTLYFILGVLAFLVFNSYSVSRPLLYSIAFCFLYACSDEIHQMFSDERTAKMLDVMIDTLGASLSCSILYMIRKKLICMKKNKVAKI